jgi:hypothetical protein
MKTRAHGDLLTRYWKSAAAALVVLLAAEIWLTIISDPKPDWPKTNIAVSLVIIPNLIANLLTVLVVFVFVVDKYRTNYVRAMRSLRTVVKKHLEARDLTADHVQELMTEFGPPFHFFMSSREEEKHG